MNAHVAFHMLHYFLLQTHWRFLISFHWEHADACGKSNFTSLLIFNLYFISLYLFISACIFSMHFFSVWKYLDQVHFNVLTHCQVNRNNWQVISRRRKKLENYFLYPFFYQMNWVYMNVSEFFFFSHWNEDIKKYSILLNLIDSIGMRDSIKYDLVAPMNVLYIHSCSVYTYILWCRNVVDLFVIIIMMMWWSWSFVIHTDVK